MTDETTANPADEPIVVADTPAEAESTEANEVADDFADLVKEGLGDDSPAEELEVEYEGKTYKVSPELKDALLRQSDYTRKTTEVAREREAVEAMRKDAEIYRNLGAATIEAAAQAKTLEGEISRLETMDISRLSQEQINGLNIQYMQLKEQKAGIDNDIRQMIETDRTRNSEELTKFQQEAIEEARKAIPNFDDKRRQDLESFAVKLGVSEDDAKTITDASAYKILHLADIGQKFLDRQRATKNVENAQAASPAIEVGGKASAAKDPNKMTTEEWMKHRQKQVS